MEVEFGSQLKEKNQFITTLSSNQHQTREEVEAIRRLKGDYGRKSVKVSQFWNTNALTCSNSWSRSVKHGVQL